MNKVKQFFWVEIGVSDINKMRDKKNCHAPRPTKF